MMLKVLSISLAAMLLAGPAFAGLEAQDELQAPRSHDDREAPASLDELQAPTNPDEIQAPRLALDAAAGTGKLTR